MGSGSVLGNSSPYPETARIFLPLISLWNFLTFKNLRLHALGSLSLSETIHLLPVNAVELNSLSFTLTDLGFFCVLNQDSCGFQDVTSPAAATQLSSSHLQVKTFISNLQTTILINRKSLAALPVGCLSVNDGYLELLWSLSNRAPMRALSLSVAGA